MPNNPYTSAQAPQSMALNLVAPEIAGKQMSLARLQQLAQMLREKGMAEPNPTQVINGWAVKQSPIEGLSRLASVLAGTFMQKKADEDSLSANADLSRKLSERLRGITSGGEQPAPQGQPTEQELSGYSGQPVSQGQPAGQGGVPLQEQLINIELGKMLGGDEGAKLISSRYMPTTMEREHQFLGISPQEARELEIAQRRVKGTQTLPPGQTAILPSGERLVGPDFGSGIAGGFDANGNPVVNAIPGATQIAGQRAGAIAEAQEGAKPTTLTLPSGESVYTTVGNALGQGQQGGAEVDKYGVPTQVLKNLVQVESSGNPSAINPKTGAAGLGQFIPSTVKMLSDQGYKFDPLNGEQSLDAMGKYLSDLVKKHGGDYRKAVAEYGGYKTKDPTEYVNKVLKGVDFGQSTEQVKSGLRVQSDLEKQAALDEQKARTGPPLAKKTKDYEVASEREASLANKLGKSTDLMKRLKVTEDALQEFTTGGGTEARSKVAQMAQVLNLPQNVIDRIAGGDLGAMQVVKKTALQEALLQMQQAMSSDSGAQQRSNQMIMEQFMASNPHLDTDPRAFEKLMNMMKDYHRSALEESSAYFKYKSEGKDITEWPNYWAQQSFESGRVKAEPTNKHPYASEVNRTKQIDDLLKKYGSKK